MPTCDVVHATTVHGPHDGRITYKEAVALRDNGYRVTVISPGEELPSIGGIQFHTIPTYSSRVFRILAGVGHVLSSAVRARPRVVHVHDPELYLPASVLRVLGVHVVIDVHEDLPLQIDDKTYISARLQRCLSKLARLYLMLAGQLSSAVVIAEPELAGYFHGVRNLALVRNYPVSNPEEPKGIVRKQLAVYAGALTESRGVAVMVEAASKLERSCIEVKLAGRADSWAKALFESRGNDDGLWLGHVTPDELRMLYAEATVGLCVLQPTRKYLRAYPTKLFEYMMAGLALIVSDFPLWRELVGDYPLVWYVDPTSSAQVVDSIEEAVDEAPAMRKVVDGWRGQRMPFLSWESEKPVLLDLYEVLVDDPKCGWV